MPWPDDPDRVRALRRLALRLIAEVPPERVPEVGGRLYAEGSVDAVAELIDMPWPDDPADQALLDAVAREQEHRSR